MMAPVSPFRSPFSYFLLIVRQGSPELLRHFSCLTHCLFKLLVNPLVLRLQLLQPLPGGHHTVGVLTKKEGRGNGT